MTRRFRICCGDAIHLATLDASGGVQFLAHPEAFTEVQTARAFAALGGAAVPAWTGCLRLANAIQRGNFVLPVSGADDGRQLLAAVRGIRLGRRLRRKA